MHPFPMNSSSVIRVPSDAGWSWILRHFIGIFYLANQNRWRASAQLMIMFLLVQTDPQDPCCKFLFKKMSVATLKMHTWLKHPYSMQYTGNHANALNGLRGLSELVCLLKILTMVISTLPVNFCGHHQLVLSLPSVYIRLLLIWDCCTMVDVFLVWKYLLGKKALTTF